MRPVEIKGNAAVGGLKAAEARADAEAANGRDERERMNR